MLNGGESMVLNLQANYKEGQAASTYTGPTQDLHSYGTS